MPAFDWGIMLKALLYGGKGTAQGMLWAKQQEQEMGRQGFLDQLRLAEEQRQQEITESQLLTAKQGRELTGLKIEGYETPEEKANREAAAATTERERQQRMFAEVFGVEAPMPPEAAPPSLRAPTEVTPMMAGPAMGLVTPETPMPEVQRGLWEKLQETPAGMTISDIFPGVTAKGPPIEAAGVPEARTMDTLVKQYKAFGVPDDLAGTPLWVSQQKAIVDYSKAEADASMAIDKAENYPQLLGDEDRQRLVLYLLTHQRLSMLGEQLKRERYAGKFLDPARLQQLQVLTEAVTKNYELARIRLTMQTEGTGGDIKVTLSQALSLIDDVAGGRTSAEAAKALTRGLPPALQKAVDENLDAAEALRDEEGAGWWETGPYGAVEPRVTE